MAINLFISENNAKNILLFCNAHTRKDSFFSHKLFGIPYEYDHHSLTLHQLLTSVNMNKILHLMQLAVITIAITLPYLTTTSSFVVLSPIFSISSVSTNALPLFAASPGAPAILDKPTTKTPEKTSKNTSDAKTPSKGWAVRLYNDPMNKREFVARCLSEICGIDDGAAFQIMMTAHKAGRSVIGNYSFEMAEFYFKALVGEGLTVDMIPLDDDK